ncbi:MAG: hypothetical protein CM15mP51_08680 [Porticoccaceae bacterium]|nr:MAG: hypothetical protein CM15mP51_08680 [Porticoccaceae bacterium]
MITDSDRLFREYVDGVSETDGIDAVNFSSIQPLIVVC